MSAVKARFTSKYGSMEAELKRRNCVSEDRMRFDSECEKDHGETKWKNPPRFTYCYGSFRILTECMDRPFWTVQKMERGHVAWFVDFPMDVGVDAVFEFIGAA